MRVKKTDADGTEYICAGKLFSVREELYIDGHALVREEPGEFLLERNGERIRCVVEGNALTGVTLHCGEKNVVIIRNKWYEWVLIMIPLLIVALLAGFWGFWGGITGGICAVITVGVNIYLLRGRQFSPAGKIALCALTTCLCMAAAAGLYYLVLYLFLLFG